MTLTKSRSMRTAFFVPLKVVLKEALYYESVNDKIIACKLCPHLCKIKPNKKGLCNTRINKNQQLFTLAYNNPSSINIDPIEKKPLYHFVPGHQTLSLATNGCVLHCAQCQNSSISQCSPNTPPDSRFNAKALIAMAQENNCHSISLTYTDPIAYYEYALEISKEAIKNKLSVNLISSGFINREPLKNIIPYLSSANIDIKSFNDKSYRIYFKGRLKPVLDSVLLLHKESIWVELTYLVIPGINDSEAEFKEFVDWLIQNKLEHQPLHLSRFYPKYRLTSIPPTPNKTIKQLTKIAKNAGIKYVYIGNCSEHRFNNTVCPECGLELIYRDHYHVSPASFVGQCTKCKTIIPGIWKA